MSKLREMKTEVVAIEKLKPHKRNARKHPVKQIAELAKSLKQFGQIRPIVVDEGNTILAGHALWRALQDNGSETANVLRKRGLSSKQKTKLMLADNKIASLGIDDYAIIMDNIISTGDYDIPGYDQDVLKSLLDDVDGSLDKVGLGKDFDGKDADDFFGKKGAGKKTEIVIVACPHCGEEFQI